MEISLNDESLKDRVVIITGVDNGVGYETALELVKRGDHVIMTCKDLNHGKQLQDKIKFQCEEFKIDVEELDLADFSSIKSFANRIIEKQQHIDILINNEGVMMCPQMKTKNGYEMQFGVNYLGHFMLTNLLLDLLKKSAPSRIINVSHVAYKAGQINWDDINCEQRYNRFTAFAQSKFAMVLFSVELAKRLKDTGVSVVTVHPGIVRDELKNCLNDVLGCLNAAVKPILPLFTVTAEQGAQAIIHCATMDDISKYSGSYFSNAQPQELSSKASNVHTAKKLWELSVDLTQIEA